MKIKFWALFLALLIILCIFLGKYTYDETKDAAYVPVHLGETLWSIAVSFSEDEILSSLDDFRRNLILILALFLIGTAIFSFIGLRGWLIVREHQKRILAEEELLKSRARLSRAQEMAHLGNWEYDVENGTTTWSDEAYRIFGLAPQEVKVSKELLIGMVHPDDRARVEKGLRKQVFAVEPSSGKACAREICLSRCYGHRLRNG